MSCLRDCNFYIQIEVLCCVCGNIKGINVIVVSLFMLVMQFFFTEHETEYLVPVILLIVIPCLKQCQELFSLEVRNVG